MILPTLVILAATAVQLESSGASTSITNDLLHVDFVSPEADHNSQNPRPTRTSEGAFVLSIVARSGQEPPGRPGETFSRLFGPSIADNGHVVFKADFDGPLSGNEGMYRFAGGLLSRVLDDSASFFAPDGGSWSSFGPPVTNRVGNVLYRGNVSFGDSDQGVFIVDEDEGSVTTILDNSLSYPVPGHPTALGFTSFPFSPGIIPLLTDAGSTAVVVDFRLPPATDIEGLFYRRADGTLVLVADQTTAPPGQPAALFESFNWFMALGGAGHLVFVADYTGGVGANGLYRYDGASGTLETLADATVHPPDQPAPARFTTINTFPSVNDDGVVVFGAQYAGGIGASGIFMDEPGQPMQPIADTSGEFPVPGQPAAEFIGFGAPVINANNVVLFPGLFGPLVADTGLYVRIEEDDIRKIMDFGDPVPGQPGAQFFGLGDGYIINAAGHVVFVARYSGGVGDEGIYFYDGTALTKIVDESDTPGGLELTNLHLMLGLGGSGGQDGKPKGMNDADQIVFRATLADDGDAILLAEPLAECRNDTGIETVLIGSPGNLADTNGHGAVGYDFHIAATEVTNAQYVEFLNAVAASDPNGLYDDVMTASLRGGITRGGVAGSYTYAVKPNFGDKPASGFAWPAGARFCNWLHNGRPLGVQDSSTTENGAYDMSVPIGLITRNPAARWFIPNEDEWYKAAYFDPTDPGADAGGTIDYWDYPTRSDVLPIAAIGDSVGNVINPGPNVANHSRNIDWNGTDCDNPSAPCGNVSTVGSAGATSPWGAFDMGGNLYEWTETIGRTIAANPPSIPEPLPTRVARGGDFANSPSLMRAVIGIDVNMQSGAANFGMRVASTVPCTPDCPVDLTTQGAGQGDPGYGVPDGLVTGSDLQWFVDLWFQGDPSADLTTLGAPIGSPSFGVPDGLVTGADLLFFVNLWLDGCP